LSTTTAQEGHSLSYGTPPPTDGPYGPQPPYGGQSAPTHGSATTALVLGILSFVVCGLLGIPAYIIGKRAEREVRASQGTLSGEGLAKAGWILGLVAMILTVLALLLVVGLLALGSTGTFDNMGSEPR
jgi:ABC-type Fe3+ transport system permease subunit